MQIKTTLDEAKKETINSLLMLSLFPSYLNYQILSGSRNKERKLLLRNGTKCFILSNETKKDKESHFDESVNFPVPVCYIRLRSTFAPLHNPE